MSLAADTMKNTAAYITNMLSPSPFTNSGDVSNMNAGQFILFLIILFLVVYIMMWIGARIFNNTVVVIMPSIKRVTVLQFFGLTIVLHMLFN
jgi:hypothetical protein